MKKGGIEEFDELIVLQFERSNIFSEYLSIYESLQCIAGTLEFFIPDVQEVAEGVFTVILGFNVDYTVRVVRVHGAFARWGDANFRWHYFSNVVDKNGEEGMDVLYQRNVREETGDRAVRCFGSSRVIVNMEVDKKSRRQNQNPQNQKNS